jgi:magnesium transporter
VDLILTSLTASVAMVTAVTSLFAMNLELQPGIQGQGPWAWFVAVSVTSAVAAICIFCGVLLYARKKRLI